MEKQLIRLWNATPVLAVIGIVSIVMLWPHFNEWEGQLHPPISKATITSSKMSRGQRRVAFTFEKLRSCDFVSAAWYWKDDKGQRHRIPFRPGASRGNDLTRPVGHSESVHYLETKLPIERLHATVRHRCHPLWETVTIFYP